MKEMSTTFNHPESYLDQVHHDEDVVHHFEDTGTDPSSLKASGSVRMSAN